MSASIQQNRPFFRIVMLGLLAWGLFVALGTFLGPEFWTPRQTAEQQNSPTAAAAAGSEIQTRALTTSFDYRKPVIVVSSVGIFLGIWAALLYSRQKKLDRAALEPKP